jgi:hypothetical protein
LDETRGWVNRHLIEESPQLQSAPRVDPEDVQLLRGRVSDEVGTPISGIQFSLTLGDLRLDARTDDQGDLYFYLPSDASGDWLVTFVAVGCPSNVFADNTCAGYKPGYTGTVQPDALPVTLPNDGVLAFRWE